MPRIPVNAPCPCGSGKKYKKCCRDIEEGAQHVAAAYAKRQQERDEHRRRFGHVRPVVQADFKGSKFIAVANRLYHSDQWKTMTDFLGDYIKLIFGREWWLDEAKKPSAEAHPVLKLSRLAFDHMTRNAVKEGGLLSVTPDSAAFEYLSLSYDLYVLRNQQSIQNSIIKRLRLADQFRGARYELLAAASLVRAGCELTYVKENKSEGKCPEFIARHAALGAVAAVEAKARHRGGRPYAGGRLGLVGLMRDALEKRGEEPLVVFVDLDVPPECLPARQEALLELLHQDVEQAQGPAERDGFALLVFTNQHVAPGAPSDLRHISMVGRHPDRPLHPELLAAILHSLKQRGNIPSILE